MGNPQGSETLAWHIGSALTDPDAPRRVHFFWKRGSAVCRVAEYGLIELEQEIARREAARMDTLEFEQARDRLLQDRRTRRRVRRRRKPAQLEASRA
ncbi:MAG TPA: hypothetical protein VOA87_08040 [Thermoanaerobaculia bacterium]|nr:hypothetical protein [Thermoanaerobaculia bacterium]